MSIVRFRMIVASQWMINYLFDHAPPRNGEPSNQIRKLGNAFILTLNTPEVDTPTLGPMNEYSWLECNWSDDEKKSGRNVTRTQRTPVINSILIYGSAKQSHDGMGPSHSFRPTNPPAARHSRREYRFFVGWIYHSHQCAVKFTETGEWVENMARSHYNLLITFITHLLVIGFAALRLPE